MLEQLYCRTSPGKLLLLDITQLAITCSNLTIETLNKGVKLSKYISHIGLVFLLLTFKQLNAGWKSIVQVALQLQEQKAAVQ